MELRFYLDAETGLPHMARHRVSEADVEHVLAFPLEDGGGAEGTRVAIGRTAAGRFLKVIYVPDPAPDSAFVITAFEPGPKALKALRRRLKRRR